MTEREDGGFEIWYENPLTRTGFALGDRAFDVTGTVAAAQAVLVDGPPAGFRLSNLHFNMNFFRPNFFAEEAMPLVTELAQVLELQPVDPGTRKRVPPDSHSLIDLWNTGNVNTIAALVFDTINDGNRLYTGPAERSAPAEGKAPFMTAQTLVEQDTAVLIAGAGITIVESSMLERFFQHNLWICEHFANEDAYFGAMYLVRFQDSVFTAAIGEQGNRVGFPDVDCAMLVRPEQQNRLGRKSPRQDFVLSGPALRKELLERRTPPLLADEPYTLGKVPLDLDLGLKDFDRITKALGSRVGSESLPREQGPRIISDMMGVIDSAAVMLAGGDRPVH